MTPASNSMMCMSSSQNLRMLLYMAKGTLATVMRLRILRGENYPELPGQALCNHRGPCNREAGDQRDRGLQDDENRFEDATRLTENGERGRESRNAAL